MTVHVSVADGTRDVQLGTSPALLSSTAHERVPASGATAGLSLVLASPDVDQDGALGRDEGKKKKEGTRT
jgi:hypothetical protein